MVQESGAQRGDCVRRAAAGGAGYLARLGRRPEPAQALTRARSRTQFGIRTALAVFSRSASIAVPFISFSKVTGNIESPTLKENFASDSGINSTPAPITSIPAMNSLSPRRLTVRTTLEFRRYLPTY